MSDTPRCNELINKHGFSTTRNGDKAVLVSGYRFSEDAFAHARQLERELADKEKQLAEARADADHWKSECNTLQRMVHEALAEIERLKKQNLDRASATLWAIMRRAFMDGAFKGYQHGTEERLRIQYFNEWCQKNYPEAVDEAIAQMRLIEQMGEALKLADDLIDEYAADYEHRDNVDEIREEIKAALAAERGGK